MVFPYANIAQAADIPSVRDRLLYRFFEIVPALLAWVTIGGIFFASWQFPVAASIFIIVFDLYWLFKTIFLSIHLRAGYKEMKRRLAIRWQDELDQLKTFPPELHLSSWRDVRHLVILPFYNEPYALVRGAVEAIRSNEYPLDRFWVVLAAEERAGSEAREIAERIAREYADVFGAVRVSIHPKDRPGELAGKGSNETWAIKSVKQELVDRAGIPLPYVLVSSFDIDTQVPPRYFACLTYHYLTTSQPLRSSYQPIPVYSNNIWDAPAFSRVVATSGTFWQTMQQVRPERLTTFSSFSVPMQVLDDVGYWQTNIVSEDSRIFWQALLFYNGAYETVPLFYPVYMDANVAPTLLATAKNVYRQQRRWGWGVENVPYLLFGFLKNKKIPSGIKWYFALIQFEGFWSWATNALLLFFLGWMPILLGDVRFNVTVLSYNLPRITRTIMTLAMLGLVTSAIISTSMLPKRPEGKPVRTYLWMALQWLLLPITIIIFGAIPGLEAQTRLAIGKRLDFWTTPKYREASDGLGAEASRYSK